ncbi:MAG: hypothetical protein OEZ22_01925 [Spirochaetia bacterium]|nr:hypothetical protein [Spirochaetia bacterium]
MKNNFLKINSICLILSFFLIASNIYAENAETENAEVENAEVENTEAENSEISNTEEPANNETDNTEITNTEEPANPDTYLKKKKKYNKKIQILKEKESETANKKKDQDNLETEEDKKTPEDLKLKNAQLMEYYLESEAYGLAAGEHFLVNMAMGFFSGGILGAIGGLSFYKTGDSENNKKYIYIFCGAGGLSGFLAGAAVTYFESRKNEQFTIGTSIMNYTFYGAIGGFIAGALGGAIPYAQSGDTGEILKFGGYGTLGGIFTGLTVYLIKPPENTTFEFKLYDNSIKNWKFNFLRKF